MVDKSTASKLSEALQSTVKSEASSPKTSGAPTWRDWRDTTNNMTFGQRSKGALYETIERETLGNMGSFGEAIQMWRTGQFGLGEAFKRVGLDILKRETLGNMGIFGELLNAHYKLDGIKDIIDKSAIEPNRKFKAFEDLVQGLKDVDEHAQKMSRELLKNDKLLAKNVEKAVKELDSRSEKRFDTLSKKIATNFMKLSEKITEAAKVKQSPTFSGGERTNSTKKVKSSIKAPMSPSEAFGKASTYKKAELPSILSKLPGGAIPAIAGGIGILGSLAGLLTIGSGNSTINDALGITPDMTQEEISKRKKWFNSMRKDPKIGYDGALKKAQEKFKNGNPQNDTIVTPKAPSKLKGSSGEDRLQEEGDIKKIEDWNVYSSQHINIEAQKILTLKASSIILDTPTLKMPDSFWDQVSETASKLMVADAEDTGESGEGDGQAVKNRRKQKGLSPIQQRMKMGQGLSVPYTSNYGIPSTTHTPFTPSNPNVPYDGWAIDPSGQPSGQPQGSPGGTGGNVPYSSNYGSPERRADGPKEKTIDASGVGKLYAPEGQNTDDLSDIDANQLKFVRAIAQSETNWDRKEAYTDRNNVPNDVWDGKRLIKKGNANVRNAMARGMSEEEAKAEYGDYGHFQMNRHDVNEAIKKYGLDPNIAKHLYGGGAGGNSTPQEQTRAMHHYLSKRYPEIYERLKTGDPKAYEDARNAMSGMYFGLRNHWERSDVQAALGGKVTPGMLGNGAPSLGKSSSMSDLNNAQKYLEGQLAKAPDGDKEAIQKQLDQIKELQTKMASNPTPQTATESAVKVSNQQQVTRPDYVKGKLTVEDKVYDYGTGAPGAYNRDMHRGSIPYGSFQIESGLHSSNNPRFNNNSFGVKNMYDPKWGTDRQGILLHSARDLDKLYSAGCLAVRKDQWPAFKAHMLDMMKRNGGKLTLNVNPDGSASIVPSNATVKTTTTDNFVEQQKDKDALLGKTNVTPDNKQADSNSPSNQQQPPPNQNRPADKIVPPSQSSDTSKEGPKVPPAPPAQNDNSGQQQANEAAARSGPNPNATDNKTSSSNEEPELKMPSTQHNPDKHKGGPADKSRGENEEDDFSLNI
jgi:hypothetical protein